MIVNYEDLQTQPLLTSFTAAAAPHRYACLLSLSAQTDFFLELPGPRPYVRQLKDVTQMGMCDVYFQFTSLVDVWVSQLRAMFRGAMSIRLEIRPTIINRHRNTAIPAAVFNKPAVNNTVIFNTAVFFLYRYTAHP